MTVSDDSGWAASAGAWLRHQGERGDWARSEVLDAVMLPLALRPGQRFIDIGCGEGPFSRMLRAGGMTGSGLDPTEALIAEARRRDPEGDFCVGQAEALPFPDAAFELAVFYLSLIDIPDLEAAVTEAVRVLKPGGRIVLANLSSVDTARVWRSLSDSAPLPVAIDRYMESRAVRQNWHGIRIVNWHRPYSTYFAAFLSHGLVLRQFLEPLPAKPSARQRNYSRMPWFVVMEWERPA